ncbi:MAG: hypothetical protein LBH98_08155 [Chitinispirillales bacterium]|jgi:hypothetical protein|nr:hypothetical protein [Chitinispirillales bacterium]
MSNDELEFDVGISTAAGNKPTAAQKKNEVTKTKESGSEAAKEPKPESVKREEKAETVDLSAKPKPESVKREEKIEMSSLNLDDDCKVRSVNVIDKLEKWLKDSNGIRFWLKVKAICILPFLLILIVFIIVYSTSLSAANKKTEEAIIAKEAIETQLAESNGKIEALDKTIEKLQGQNRRLTNENNKLKKQIKPAAKPVTKPAANTKNKK